MATNRGRVIGFTGRIRNRKMLFGLFAQLAGRVLHKTGQEFFQPSGADRLQITHEIRLLPEGVALFAQGDDHFLPFRQQVLREIDKSAQIGNAPGIQQAAGARAVNARILSQPFASTLA